jgi:RHS repeat-associated protein
MRVHREYAQNTATINCFRFGLNAWPAHYFLRERLSERLNLSSSGSVQGAMGTLPFGEDFAESGIQEKHHFTTYDRDPTTGTDYAVNRMYSDVVGRFTRVDPEGSSGHRSSPQTWNRYAYSGGDPVNSTDPTGLDFLVCITKKVRNSDGDGSHEETQCTLVSGGDDDGGGGGGGGGNNPGGDSGALQKRCAGDLNSTINNLTTAGIGTQGNPGDIVQLFGMGGGGETITDDTFNSDMFQFLGDVDAGISQKNTAAINKAIATVKGQMQKLGAQFVGNLPSTMSQQGLQTIKDFADSSLSLLQGGMAAWADFAQNCGPTAGLNLDPSKIIAAASLSYQAIAYQKFYNSVIDNLS